MRSRFYGLVVFFLTCALPAMAQESLFNVAGVHVDASGASSTEALTTAIAEGRGRAFQTLFHRLTRQADWTRQPVLDAQGLLRLSRGYTIANERRSTTRYVADVTYMFSPDAVGRTLRAANIAFLQAAPKPILVVAMSPGVSHGPWAQALAAPALRDSIVPFSLPSPDDEAALAALNFDAAGWSDVAAVAAKNHVTEVALVQAVSANGKLTVLVRRLGPNESPSKASVDVPGGAYPAAAQAAVRLIEDMWKTHAAVDTSQRAKLVVDVRIAGLAQWSAIQAALSGIGTITTTSVIAMDIHDARIQITYGGGLDQLREQLAAQGLTLSGHAPGPWTLSKA